MAAFVSGKGVKNCSQVYGMVVIQVVISGKFCVNVKSFHCIKVDSLSMVMQHLHDAVYGAERVGFFIQMFGKV